MAKASAENRVVIKVFLYGIQPQIWRRFSISRDVTFIELSDAIQAVMGWENKHPHEFRHGKGKRLVDVIGPVGLQDQVIGEFQDEAKLTVGEFLGKRRMPIRILYRYDFADEWIHEIVFEKGEAGEGGPVAMDGERACPPEDFGGTFQYMQALHGEIEWMNPGYDPEAFDAKAVSFEKKKTRNRK
ncbi:MAG: plasmid pRiA4b ORF-3 family protein [Akkermansiaceae bacterium]|nr:plasmid pRiA4b ORF-3 family protein [Akkermansiaceae bacterium]MCP5544098.1 plasmid pRiA4b ORF-3 family protein [Akkermansiaceae bacterium]MCP5547846.1 plasmid pRiA4b ORF-3 family protein [Akkermansiaceae bacterium]